MDIFVSWKEIFSCHYGWYILQRYSASAWTTSGVSYWSSGFCVLRTYRWTHYPAPPTYVSYLYGWYPDLLTCWSYSAWWCSWWYVYNFSVCWGYRLLDDQKQVEIKPWQNCFFFGYVIILPQNCFAWCQFSNCWWYYPSIIHCAQLRCCFWPANEYGPAHHQTLQNHQLEKLQPEQDPLVYWSGNMCPYC